MSSPETADSGPETKKRSTMPKINLAPVQKFGRSLLLPIASLPAAALLLRLGQPDLLGEEGLGWNQVASVVGSAGDALFAHLPLLFALGVAIGMAKKADGSTALAALIGYLVYDAVTEAMSPLVLGAPAEGEEQALINFHVLGGIVIGLVAAWLWQRYYRIKLPPYLAFFGGRRFVPIITALAAIIIAVLMSFIYPLFDAGITALGEWVAANAVLGGFVYGMMNRLLIPLGLHHILNNPPWFILGSYETAEGTVVHGDIARFLSGDPTAGSFMTGFFPIMMFALPAAALAIYHAARPSQKKAVGGLMGAGALTAFLTGVTEPLEFAFMFVAFPLYVIHAFLTGTAMALVNFLEIKMGFGFSAGLFDFVLNWNIGTDPWLLIPIGLGYAVIYYVLFRAVIRLWNLKTPGREDEDAESTPASEQRG
ncbi:PTS transporter subunit EIIC [Nesterenkonia sp. PF2B19]|uniref:PTS transporter subunit EIIC n=1 Tax=unclassified Nesterenkonia TaxID=2629769 RepID=UPI0009F410EF|nr:PTS N-acetylglucosamine transporter subunit IIBC [Nesterenkonia sp. PF2B19]